MSIPKNPTIPYANLIEEIFEAIRKKAKTLGSLQGNDGCIRVLYRPLCADANEWYGRKGYDEADVPEYEEVRTLAPFGSHTVIEDGQPVNCYGFSAMKIASCSVNRAKAGIRLSYSDQNKRNPAIIPENGYANYRGAVCYTILRRTTNENGDIRETEYARLYACVSGGISEDDENAACATYKILTESLKADKQFRVI